MICPQCGCDLKERNILLLRKEFNGGYFDEFTSKGLTLEKITFYGSCGNCANTDRVGCCWFALWRDVWLVFDIDKQYWKILSKEFVFR